MALLVRTKKCPIGLDDNRGKVYFLVRQPSCGLLGVITDPQCGLSDTRPIHSRAVEGIPMSPALPAVASFHCEQCNEETRFLPIHYVARAMGVSRSTVYYWMEHNWVHWLEKPSGRRIICEESLIHQARQLDADLHSLSPPPPNKKNRPKLSETVRFCPIR